MFKSTAARLQAVIQWVGKTKVTDLERTWQTPVLEVAKAEAAKNPKIRKVRIKGGPHKSHTDKQDHKHVISLQFLREDDKRVKTTHVHEDGTSQEKTPKSTTPEGTPAPITEEEKAKGQ